MPILTEQAVRNLLGATVPSFQLTSRESLNLGFGFIYYGLARALRPEHVVVIGSKAGFAPICFALGILHNEGVGVSGVDCEETSLRHPGRRGRLSFVDPSYSIHRGDANHSFGVGTWDSPTRATEIFAEHGVGEIVSHFKMTSAEYLAGPGADQAIDLLYVDGDHSYAGVTHDLTAFYSLLSRDAMVLAHDVHIDCADSDGYQALCDLDAQLYEVSQIPINPGLAILRPRGTNRSS